MITTSEELDEGVVLVEDVPSPGFGGAATGTDVVVACVVLSVIDVDAVVEDISACLSCPLDIGEAADGPACLSDWIITDDKLALSVADSADDAADTEVVEMMGSIEVDEAAANEEDTVVISDVNGALDPGMATDGDEDTTDCIADVLFIFCPTNASSPCAHREEIKGG